MLHPRKTAREKKENATRKMTTQNPNEEKTLVWDLDEKKDEG